LVASRLVEWIGPLSHSTQALWLSFLQGMHQGSACDPAMSRQCSSIAAMSRQCSGSILTPEHCRALGMGGLKELLTCAPPELCCALDNQLLTNPMRSPYGHVFEYSVLASALARSGDVCPLTGQPLNMQNCENAWDVKRQADHHIGLWARTASKQRVL